VHTKEAIRFSLSLAEHAVTGPLAKIKDAPMTFPTGKGGCHPLWVMGHLAVIEGMTHQILAGGENPVKNWAPLFGQETITTADAAYYPGIDEVCAQYTQLREKNLKLLDSLSESDLDRPTTWQPKGVEEHFATYGKALLTLALHQAFHRGQLTDAIRSAGRIEAIPAVAAA
jgi:hypothetical protein